jgi:membrane associated rhomboid family serine protease
MSRGADLFVVCKSCGSEVSPYITECPYCGNRLRKRAPKLDKARREAEKRAERQAKPPRLGRIRRGEIPGIRADVRPWATIALVAASVGLSLVWLAGAVELGDVVILGDPGSEWWRTLTAPFAYDNLGYQLVALGTVALFGWLLERRLGLLAPVSIFLLGGAGGMWATVAVDPDVIAFGGNGGALALLCAWAVPDLLARRAGEDTESDLLGVAFIAGVLLLMPLAVPEADPVAGVAGGLIGAVLGLLVAALARER